MFIFSHFHNLTNYYNNTVIIAHKYDFYFVMKFTCSQMFFDVIYKSLVKL
nr:MAG TPA: hypothetical protein [Inoviridae sp.]